MQNTRPRIVIADDHAFVADACKKLLEPEYDVVATVVDGRALVRIAATLKATGHRHRHRNATSERRIPMTGPYCYVI
jgi:CheY-like chemotaxis protein